MIWKLVTLLMVWLIFSARISWSSLILGAFISTGIVLVINFMEEGDHRWGFSIPGLLMLIPWYLWQLIKAGVKLAATVFLPRHGVEERFIQIPTTFSTLTQVTLFASLITLTPGTLSVDFDVKSRLLIVHCLVYTRLFPVNDPEGSVFQLEQRLRKVFVR